MTEETEKISDFDGTSPAITVCRVCNLNVDEQFQAGPKLCKACKNLSFVSEMSKFFAKFVSPAIILTIFFLLTPSLRSYWYYPVVVVVVPVILVSAFQMKIHYYNIPGQNSIMSLLKMYNLLSDEKYYYKSLETWNLEYNNLNQHLIDRIMNELVDSVLRKTSFNPSNLFEDWSSAMGLDPNEFVEQVYSRTDILEGFSIFEGHGLLPDVWEYLLNDEIKEKTLSEILKQIDYLPDVSKKEKKMFLEDLYLLEDEIKEFIVDKPEYQPIIDELENFEPEEPPKNFIQQAQMLAQENQTN